MDTIRHLLGYPDSYYNCSGKTYEEWMETGEKWPLLGHLLMTAGTLYLILYLPTIYAMLKLKLYRNDCYKIMFCLILADIGNLLVNSFIAGYVFSVGGVFCMNDVFSFITGSYSYGTFTSKIQVIVIALVIWSIASYLYILLAFNRFVIVLNNKWLQQALKKTLFSLINSNKLFIENFPNKWPKVSLGFWLLIGISYGLWTGRRSIPFNSKAFGALYVPVIEDIAKEVPMYSNIYHVYHNLGVGVIMFGLYALIFILLAKKRNTNKISKGEMNALLQAALITLPAMIASWLYVYIQFFQIATLEMAITSHFAWQTTTGISAFIYLTMNHSVRRFYLGKRIVHASMIIEDSNKDPKITILSA